MALTTGVPVPDPEPESWEQSREASVRRELRTRLCPEMSSPNYQTQFLPRNDLYEVLTTEVVEDIVGKVCLEKDWLEVDIGREIIGENGGKCRLQILAVLVFVDTNYVLKFLEDGICDNELPLESDASVFEGWEQRDIESFCDKQRIVLAPVFSFDPSVHRIFDDSRVPMPFLNIPKWERELRGACGDVAKISIHPHHHNWNEYLGDGQVNHKEVSCFALKRFYPHRDSRFEDERRALLRFTYPKRGHEHIIKLLLSYQIADVRYLVLPWAKHNLKQFWKNTRSQSTPLLQKWLVGQCRGLADALLKIHQHGYWKGNESVSATKNWGLHGDIKPRNILYFEGKGQKQGRLVITGVHHSKDTHEHTLAKDVSRTSTYHPPEVDDDDLPIVSQEYDVWTLGCVYLEFITWYLLGYDAIFEDFFCTSDGQKRESFSTMRLKDDEKRYHISQDKFFNRDTDSATFVLKNSVREWIKYLRGQQWCSGAINDFLNLIEGEMLLPNPQKRCKMPVVNLRLREISNRCKENPNYLDDRESTLSPGINQFPPIFTKQASLHLSKSYSGPPEGISLTPIKPQHDHHDPDLNFLEATFSKAFNAQGSHDGNEPANAPQSNQYILPPDNSTRPSIGSPSAHTFMPGSSGLSGSLRYSEGNPTPLVETNAGIERQSVMAASLADSGYGTATIQASAPSQTAKDRIQEDPELGDTETVYSDAGSLKHSTIEGYISELGDGFFQQVKSSLESDGMLEHVCKALPNLIKAMALGLGHGEAPQEYRDAMRFIHENYHSITQSFRDSYFQEQENSRRAEPVSNEIMSRFLREPEGEATPPGDNTSVSSRLDSEIEDQDHEDAKSGDQNPNAAFELPRLEEYRALISNSFGYKWLLCSLEREIMLERAPEDIMQTIRRQILEAIPGSNYISRNRPSRVCTVVYNVNWDLFGFLDEQKYDEPDDEALGKAITLTGSVRSAQALTCQEYLAQTWPLTGYSLIQLIQRLVRKRDDDEIVAIARKTPSGTDLSISIVGSRLKVESSGVPEFVAEVGEQLAWLGAALPSTRRADGPLYCTPFIDVEKVQIDHATDGHISLQCSIDFHIRDCQDTPSNANGQCWHAMFGQVVIAQGFPIPRRPEADTGLEIPLYMMAALLGTRYVDVFNAKVFIKGFSAMLVPTTMIDGVLTWHLLYNEVQTKRMSYLDCSIEHLGCTIDELKPARHVIGWCPAAVCNAGIPTAIYSVEGTQLKRPHPGSTLEKLEVQAGQYVMVTGSASIGQKEKSLRISQDCYPLTILHLSEQYFVFWDEECKRGWMVDGASALLHLVRASLRRNKRLLGATLMLDDETQIKNKESALKTLLDVENRRLPLFIDNTDAIVEHNRSGDSPAEIDATTYYRLEKSIENFSRVLGQLIDRQANAKEKDGVDLTIRSRRWLTGWDFKDLACLNRTVLPRVAELKATSKQWVGFIRSIRAVTLFGRGFGELIQPKEPHCSRWPSLPSGNYYLAIRIKDLRAIVGANNGDLSTNPIKLTEDTLWHIKQNVFPHCCCPKGVTVKHLDDPVQELSSLSSMRETKYKPGVDLKDEGAVIFGCISSHGQDRPNARDSIEGVPSAKGRDSFVESIISRGIRLFRSRSSTSGSPSSSQLDASVTSVTDTSQTESVHSRSLRQRFKEKAFQKILPSEGSIKKMTGSQA